MIYDLIVVGNGIGAQVFLFELLKKLDVLESQNFSVAQIYSEEVANACSLRSVATVSLSGIEEDVSDLGNELRESYFLFEQFINKYKPNGVERINQLVSFTNEKERAKMIRRYKKLHMINNDLFKESMEGSELDAFVIGPEVLSSWFNQQLTGKGIDQKKLFLKNLTKNKEGFIECELINNEVVTAKKIVLCTGAFSKLFSNFYEDTNSLNATHTVTGSYLERSINLERPTFALTIDGHKIIYRNDDQKLIIGSVSTPDGVVMGDQSSMNEILSLFNQLCIISFGQWSDFKKVSGLRHKGVKRRPMARALDDEKKIFMINGLYKNGFSFSHLCAQKVLNEIIL